ncbi:MAG: type I-E CRISPR-associated protein Cse2/CasB [Armatimonadetes bacterium]|nr:type I-E CRISPR-associated protein Cse2/CasB [Armatimonadota bacterium]
MSQTTSFIRRMTVDRIVGPSERACLRALSGLGLDQDTSGFDVFTGLWWPLRQRSQSAPRREVAWLIAKLHAAIPVPHVRPDGGQGPSLAQVLGRSEPREEHAQRRFRCRFDTLLCNSLGALEPHLGWALSVARKAVVAGHTQGIDWVLLTDHLSIWDRGEEHRRKRDVRDIWAEQYLEATYKP